MEVLDESRFSYQYASRLHDFAKGARGALEAVKDRLVLLHPGDEIVTGFRALDTRGTHRGICRLSGGDGLIIAADVATNTTVSFEHPAWASGYDTLPDVAIRTRHRFLDRAAVDRPRPRYRSPYAGLGYAERDGTAFRFLPAP